MTYDEFLTTVTECPFCKLKQRIITENTRAYLTYALAPYHPDHLLVVPKEHIEHVNALTHDTMVDMDALEKIGLRILNKLGYADVTFLLREGMGSGKSVPHIHTHLIPKIVLGDTEHSGKGRDVLSDDEVEKLMERLTAQL